MTKPKHISQLEATIICARKRVVYREFLNGSCGKPANWREVLVKYGEYPVCDPDVWRPYQNWDAMRFEQRVKNIKAYLKAKRKLKELRNE